MKLSVHSIEGVFGRANPLPRLPLVFGTGVWACPACGRVGHEADSPPLGCHPSCSTLLPGLAAHSCCWVSFGEASSILEHVVTAGAFGSFLTVLRTSWEPQFHPVSRGDGSTEGVLGKTAKRHQGPLVLVGRSYSFRLNTTGAILDKLDDGGMDGSIHCMWKRPHHLDYRK